MSVDSDPVVEEKIRRWLTDRPTFFERVSRGLLALWYNKIPKHIRVFTILHWLSETALASSGPAVAYLLSDKVSFWSAVTLSVVIFLVRCLIGVFYQLSREKTPSEQGLAEELVVRFSEIISSMPPDKTHQDDKHVSITAALDIIEIAARKITKAEKGDISVCLATRNGSSEIEMKIRHRNRRSERPLMRFQADRTLAYRACKAGGDPRVINDIRDFGKFGRQSPTQSVVNYRSIFVVPISHGGEPGKIVGWVSIDSRRPYAFYGNRASAIIVLCEPFVNHIAELV